ncbi:unnamed protein product [Prorocentrum cordatum]|uniref:Uncharacterized protein n=1 Tax=Prorocentrum cordatum TaxID=2364126 RepID=A0ABN9XIP0_9DINO|nr:unnamed protein product [Polarella glacialis]
MLQCASHNWWTCAPARNRKQFAKLSPASLCMHEEEEEEGGGGGLAGGSKKLIGTKPTI